MITGKELLVRLETLNKEGEHWERISNQDYSKLLDKEFTLEIKVSEMKRAISNLTMMNFW